MKVGDLVKENSDSILGFDGDADSDSLGIILAVEDGIATVSWFHHEIFGAHESYCTRAELIFLIKILDNCYPPC